MKTTSIAPNEQKESPADSSPENGHARLSLDGSLAFSNARLIHERERFRAGLSRISPKRPKLKIVILASSAPLPQNCDSLPLFRELGARGHEVLSLERKASAVSLDHRAPLPVEKPSLYQDLRELKGLYAGTVREADAVMVCSQLPDGAAIGEWALRTAGGPVVCYDTDTPATLGRLEGRSGGDAAEALISKYALYLSSAGGSALEELERLGSPMARPLYPSVDPRQFYPEPQKALYNLGYISRYNEETQPALDELLLQPARDWEKGRFIVAGGQYPRSVRWPKNVTRRSDLPHSKRRAFYCSQRFALVLTQSDIVERGCTPSVPLLEAAACGTPIISDFGAGPQGFFEPNEELLISHSSEETLYYLLETSDSERAALARKARSRVLSEHTTRHRAIELENYLCDLVKPAQTPESVP